MSPFESATIGLPGKTSNSDSDYSIVEACSDGSEDKGHLPTDEFAEMDLHAEERIRRKDEYDVDFADPREFAYSRWLDITKESQGCLNPSDKKLSSKFSDMQGLNTEIQGKILDPASTSTTRRYLKKIVPLPKKLSTLTFKFSQLAEPLNINYDILWALIYLNLKFSYTSPERLKFTTDTLYKLCNVVSLFNRIVDSLDQRNDPLILLVDFLDPIATILTDSLTYLRSSSTDVKAEQAWPDVNENINTQLGVLDGIVKHVSEITSYSKVNMDRRIKILSARHALVPESEESGSFPIKMLPFSLNTGFYGREEELAKIAEYLRPKNDESLRTYTIYGRRGVGKTEIAVQYALTNNSEFDAIFWIQCETSVAIRKSFDDVAKVLGLPLADAEGRHEENLMAVKQWLKKTSRKWLMIFDNAERDQILQAYWPLASSGAILITSRSYYNFAKDTSRQGETIKPFNSKQSWDLLFRLLGGDWKTAEQEGRLSHTETMAAKGMLSKLEGLALAIQQMAILINNPDIGGPTIAKTFEMFKERVRNLPDRHSNTRSPSVKALDALWDMTFNSLNRNSRSLLGVLSWLSPDSILVEIFNPRNQKALDGMLFFCKQEASHDWEHDRASLQSIISPSPGFEQAVRELLAKKLVKQDGRVLNIHRVVQEAVNFHDIDDIQESFDTASRLVYEQFPKQEGDGSLYGNWDRCQNYIHHGVYLSKKFDDEYARPGIVKGSEWFVRLLSNCAWYLHETGSYDVSKRVVETAIFACDDKTSLLYAQLLNITGSRLYDWNRLNECRTAWETTLRIRKARLPKESQSIAAIYSNLGNLETALGNLGDAEMYFDRAYSIWVASGDGAASFLATTYLCMGRMYMLRGNLKEAERYTSLSESLLFRTIGSDKGFMVHVHYAQGNLYTLRRQLTLAKRSYELCLNIGKSEMPIHPITAASYYSLGNVELEMKNFDLARGYFEKAKAIAELRSPSRDDGVIARILWRIAVVLESDTFGRYATEAAQIRTRAETARQLLVASGEGGNIPDSDEAEVERDEDKDKFDALVPLFFR